MEDEVGVADALQAVEVAILRAGGNGLASSPQVDCSSHTNTGLESGVKALIIVAVRDKVRFDIVSIDVSSVTHIALTNNSVAGLIGSSGLAGPDDQIVAFIAVALTPLEIAVDSIILVTAALSIDDREACIADAAATAEVHYC